MASTIFFAWLAEIQWKFNDHPSQFFPANGKQPKCICPEPFEKRVFTPTLIMVIIQYILQRLNNLFPYKRQSAILQGSKQLCLKIHLVQFLCCLKQHNACTNGKCLNDFYNANININIGLLYNTSHNKKTLRYMYNKRKKKQQTSEQFYQNTCHQYFSHTLDLIFFTHALTYKVLNVLRANIR